MRQMSRCGVSIDGIKGLPLNNVTLMIYSSHGHRRCRLEPGSCTLAAGRMSILSTSTCMAYAFRV